MDFMPGGRGYPVVWATWGYTRGWALANFIPLTGRRLNVDQVQKVYYAPGDMAQQPRCEVVFEGNYRLSLEGDDATRLDEYLRRYEATAGAGRAPPSQGPCRADGRALACF
jgi:hypothetical protein